VQVVGKPVQPDRSGAQDRHHRGHDAGVRLHVPLREAVSAKADSVDLLGLGELVGEGRSRRSPNSFNEFGDVHRLVTEALPRSNALSVHLTWKLASEARTTLVTCTDTVCSPIRVSAPEARA
jgi:hypothetical protein